MVVRLPKTERIAGREARVVPIFPELRPYLEQLWDRLPEGAPDGVITRYRRADKLWAGLRRWCLAAGVKPWAVRSLHPQPWQQFLTAVAEVWAAASGLADRVCLACVCGLAGAHGGDSRSVLSAGDS
ncbi:MAG: hypothetical protein RMJ88_04165 [Thermogemmata sp.]|nr:hypothetical protein [Thermogemmata sp.]